MYNRTLLIQVRPHRVFPYFKITIALDLIDAEHTQFPYCYMILTESLNACCDCKITLKIEKTLPLISEVVISPYGKQLRVFIIVVSSPHLKISRHSLEYPEEKG